MTAASTVSADALARLVRATLQGDDTAFERLIELHDALVYSEAVRQCPEHARDVAQETFVRAYRKLPNLRKPERFTAWLYAMVRNVAREYRRRYRTPMVSLESVPECELPTTAPVFQPELQPILEAVANLRPEYRLPLVLRYQEGLSYETIGARLAIGTIAARSRVHRARHELATRLGR